MNYFNPNLKAIIIAGGEGTRIRSISDKPKCLFKYNKNFLLEIIYKKLIKNNIKDITLISGYKSELIEKKLKGKLKNIKLIKETIPLGTAGCLKLIPNNKKDILLIFGDLLFDLDIKRVLEFHKKKKSDLTLFVHPNSHPYDSDLVVKDSNSKLIRIIKKPHKIGLVYNNLVMMGVFLISKELLYSLKNKKDKKLDFTKDFIISLLKKKKKIFCYETREYCKDMGTPDRYNDTLKDYKESKPSIFNYQKKLPAIFLDRDGVINKDLGPFKYSDPLDIYKDVFLALKLINKSNYLSVLITNQPHVAKGFITMKYLSNSFKKLETKLGDNKIYLDKIYFCPHYPVSGFKGEIKKLKINCKCRKPKIGLLLSAKKDLNIDMNKSYFIGNSEVDYNTALNAGVKSIIIRNKLFNIKGAIKKKNLLQAVRQILKKENS
jgi:mannose-1-phosphate guanylyltransferase/phosphomannomutase